ncbi:MAG: RNA-binding protein [Desulfurococcales archaeon]|nr:RNA-binding protein [Desulfurococcales archaeon]
MNTAEDFRLKMAELAVEVLSRRVRQWGMPWPLNKSKALETLEALRREVKRLRYSFLPPEMLIESESMNNIVSLAGGLRRLLIPQVVPKLDVKRQFALAEIRWALSILLGLPLRLRLGSRNYPEFAVDVVGVEVTRIEPLKGTERLKVTRASMGRAAFTVVTNLEDISKGQVRAIAILPPALFGDVISEAMYASDPLPREYLGKRVPRKFLHGEVGGLVVKLLESIK